MEARMPVAYALLVLLWMLPLTLGADGPAVATMEGKVLADEPWGSNESAMPIGLIGDMMIVGTSTDGEAGILAGAVWVFKRVGQQWVQTQKILPTNPLNSMRFGWSLSVEEQIDTGEAWLAVGAPQHDNVQGRVDMYKRVVDTWEFQSTLSLPEGLTGSLFGQDVSINVDIPLNEVDYLWTVAIGVPSFTHEVNGFPTGAVFISNLNSLDNWTPPAMPLGDAPGADAQSAQIGAAVAIDGDVIIAGAPVKRVSGQISAGAIYLYVRSAAGVWAAQSMLDNPDAIDGEMFGGANFGKQVAVVKQIIPTREPTGNYYYVVGAPTSTSEHAGGQVYIFDGVAGSIINTQRIFRPDQTESTDSFGWDVAINQDLINGDHEIVISSRVQGNGPKGAIFLYDQSDLQEPWLPLRKLIITDIVNTQPGATASLGQSVAGWGGWIAATASNLVGTSDAVYTNPIVHFRDGFE